MAQQTQQREYKRFSKTQRFEHMVLLVTFSGLALTGLPQRYADQSWAQSLIAIMGGIEGVRIVHRILATLLMAEAIFHGSVLSYKLFVLGQRATMMPGFRDMRDVFQWILHNLGLRREHPKMPRYNFGEKAEYLAVVWGTLIMILTGFMLWNPIATTNILPGEAIPAARAAHSAEALLAVLSIAVWHMYNVHLRRWNHSMFSGNLSHEAMAEEHGEELEAIERGRTAQRLPDHVIAKRRRYFWPYAIGMTVMLTVGLIWFITFEQTAITTLPVRQSVVSVTLNADSGSVEEGATLWETLNCQSCHGVNADGGGSPFGVSLLESEIDFVEFVEIVRLGPADMPAYNVTSLSNAQLADLWVWLTLQISKDDA